MRALRVGVALGVAIDATERPRSGRWWEHRPHLLAATAREDSMVLAQRQM